VAGGEISRWTGMDLVFHFFYTKNRRFFVYKKVVSYYSDRFLLTF
jgi:hypothetical protein